MCPWNRLLSPLGSLLMIWFLAVGQNGMAEEQADWANGAEQPLWSFAWISDLHIGTAKPEFIAKALHHIDAELKPHFLVITGDNNFIEAPLADPNQPETTGLRRQRFLKQFLQDNLKTPYVLIPGNNWPEEFDKVFGAKQYSFDCGGLHFMLLDADRVYRGAPGQNAEGYTVFNDSTFEWIQKDLERHRQQPTIVAMHEPICPQTFLDAPRLRELLDRFPNVFLVLQGHLHADMEIRHNCTTYLVAPALGKTPSPAMKLLDVYPQGLIVRTIPYDKAKDQFEMTSRCQKIELADSLRAGLAKPAGPDFVKANYDCVPAHPHVDDPALAGRFGELLQNGVQSLGKDFIFRKK